MKTAPKILHKKKTDKKRKSGQKKTSNDNIFTMDENGVEEEYVYDENEGAYVKKKAIDVDTLECDEEEIRY